MTRDEAKQVVKYIDLIKYFAEGGDLQFEYRDFKGDFLEWSPVRKRILIQSLDRMRILEGSKEKNEKLNRECTEKKLDRRKCRHCPNYYPCSNRLEKEKKA